MFGISDLFGQRPQRWHSSGKEDFLRRVIFGSKLKSVSYLDDEGAIIADKPVVGLLICALTVSYDKPKGFVS